MNTQSKLKHLVVVGGGAAGFFCAINAARLNSNLKIIILEKQSKVLQKVKVSGGGRCNVTNACTQHAELISHYPRGRNFLKKAFTHFSTKDTIAWFQACGVELKAEADGRMFPISNSSQTIIDCLLKEVDRYNIEVKLHAEVASITKQEEGFTIELATRETLHADYLFLACGGFPKQEQYHWILKLGHRIEQPTPSLFTFNLPSSTIKNLMGLVVDNATVKVIGTKLQEQGPVLITHWGLSGPAILRLSAWGARIMQEQHYRFSICINWLSQAENKVRDDWNSIRIRQSSAMLGSKNPFGLPKRLWDYVLNEVGINETIKWSELPSKEQNKLIHILTTHELLVEGKTTFKEEFVTCGGISLSEIDANTMESKLHKNLYFGGELMDVDGVTGGFNFQHAWTSGYNAAQGIGNSSK